MFFSLDSPYPLIFDHDEDKLSSLALRCFEGRKIAGTALVYCFLLGEERCLFIIVYRCVINDGLTWSGERGGIVCHVYCRVLYNPDKFLYLVFLVIRNDKEDL